MSQPGAAPDPGAAQPPKPRRRRWMLRVLVAMALLLIVVIVATQIILQTDLPRRIVLAQLQDRLGLRIEAASLSTGWFGRTTLRNVTVALPLADDAFLQSPTLNVTHSSLPVLLLSQSLDIKAIEFHQPRLIVRQDAQGGWNVQEAIALATRSAGTGEAEASSSAAPAQLPRVAIAGATITLIDIAGKTASLAPVEFRGHPDDPVSWSFQADLATQIRLEGRIAPGQNWNHLITFSVDDPAALLKPWLADRAKSIQVQGEWRGRVAGATLAGQLELQKAKFQNVDVSGAAELEASAGRAVVMPRTLLANVGGGTAVPIRVVAGSIGFENTRVSVEDLRLHLLGGAARLQGRFDSTLKDGRLEAAWMDLAWPADVRHRGQLTATLQTPWANRPRIQLDLHTLGATSRGQWDAQLALSGQGQSWSVFDWTLSLPRAAWTGKPSTITLQDVVARLTSDQETLRLVDLRWKETDRLAGTGQFRFDQRAWNVDLKAQGVTLPRLNSAANVALSAAGDAKQIQVPELRLRTASLTALAKASYDFARSKPFEADLQVWQTPPAPDEPRTVAGAVVRGEAHIGGTLQPLSADMTARLVGRDVYLGKRQLGDVTVQLAGNIDPSGATLDSQEISLLDGHWTLHGRYRFDDGTAGLAVVVRDLSLQQADALVDPPPHLTGTLGAEVRMDLPEGDRSRLSVEGDWLIRDLQRGPFRAERILGRLGLEDRVLVLDDIQLNQQLGRGVVEARYDLRQRNQLSVLADLKDWPVELSQGPLLANVTGGTRVKIDLAQKSAVGPAELNASVQLRGKDLAQVQLTSAFQGREIDVSAVKVTLLEGGLDGQAHLTLNDPLQSTAKLTWRNLDAVAIADLVPMLQGLQGRFSGSLEAGRPADPRTPEPLRVQVQLNPANASYKALSLGPSNLTVLVGRTDGQKGGLPSRLVIDRSFFDVAGGQLSVWGRATSHLGADLDFLLTQVEFADLNLDQLVHTLEPEAEPMVGRLAGQFTLFGPRRDLKQMRGDAVVRLTQSDLGNSDVIAAFYRTFSLQRGPLQPTGSGIARLRLEDGLLQVPNLRYQTRGLDMRATGQVQDVFRAPGSSISGYAIGSARPLRDIRLPFMAELDDIIGAIQTNVTTFRIEGTIRDPKVLPAAFTDINDTLRRIVFDELGLGNRR